MTDLQAGLKNFKPSHSYFVGIDSDGCAFDTMELKHKECFTPNTVKHYGLQAVSKYAREAAEFINLYSEWRGVNRFPSLALTLNLLRERPEVARRGVKIRSTDSLQRFIDSGKPLSNPSLRAEAERSGDAELQLALRWSEAVNRDIADMVHGVPPFPRVRDCLEKFSSFADQMCVSATPVEALTAEWQEHDIAGYVCLIVGQEIASKKEALGAAVAAGYARGKVLMIGDAPGDLQAARANGALFFPVLPGAEEESWERLHAEGLEKFRAGSYAGGYEEKLVHDFLAMLPGTPPWKGNAPRQARQGR